jgi:general secretion pathway protein F/type IV pilus assembly protein PilC
MSTDRALFGFIRPAPPGPRKLAELRCHVAEVLAASVARDVPLAPVVAAAAAENRGYARRALTEFHRLLESGAGLAAAMDASRLLRFPEHSVAAVGAAEGTPRLASVLASVAADDAEIDNRRAAIWAAIVYPMLVVAFVGGVSGGILGPTRDRLVQVVESMDVTPAAYATLETSAKVGAVAGWIALTAAEIMAAVWIVRRVPALMFGMRGVFRTAWQAMPFVRGPARLGAASRLLRGLASSARSAVPLHEALRAAAPSAGCRPVSKSAQRAAALARDGAGIEDVAAALILPASVRARFALAATRAPGEFADTLQTLAGECAERYRNALDTRMRWLQPVLTVFVGALVLSQLVGIFAMLEIVRRQVPPW